MGCFIEVELQIFDEVFAKSVTRELAKKENEITLLQTELEQLRERLNIPETEKISGSYVQTTFES